MPRLFRTAWRLILGLEQQPETRSAEKTPSFARRAGAETATVLGAGASSVIGSPRSKRGKASYSAAACATVAASPATVVRRMSRGWASS